MQLGLTSIFRFLDATSSQTLVLATVIKTTGASYRKAGAMMLIDQHLQSSGLLSGGCLEDDLKEHARRVFETGLPHTVNYDLGNEESASPWGLGLGCGGEIVVLLERIQADDGYGGLSLIREHWDSGLPCGLIKTVAHVDSAKTGQFAVCLPGQQVSPRFGIGRFEMSRVAVLADTAEAQVLAIPISPANRLLVCGGGPDAVPLVTLASQLFWRVTVVDHRPAYATRDNFPAAEHILCCAPEALAPDSISHHQAAVIMTHNVARDVAFIRRLAGANLPYLGLLGPTARRAALLEMSGLSVALHGPAGLDIGAVLPEEIALAIMAEIHAVLAGRRGGTLSS